MFRKGGLSSSAANCMLETYDWELFNSRAVRTSFAPLRARYQDRTCDVRLRTSRAFETTRVAAVKAAVQHSH
jgi:hypothetical protein